MRKSLKCPVCDFRIIDTDAGSKSELKAEKDIPPGWKADYYQKCPKCKNQIGIRKVS